ncbi:O-antigen ligase family protein [Arthrobacter sp. ERGS1:01]|uniref:O-antigen ligase family protein n=1 Tax=Arthrobacter sp. ERGS1:01 TaxID=1704044 RepID=UPI001364D61A|nr:hypothetical protein [Arthrobacter sp. ERGS1:01]
MLFLLSVGVTIPLAETAFPFLETLHSASVFSLYGSIVLAVGFIFHKIAGGDKPGKIHVVLSSIVLVTGIIPFLSGPALYEGNTIVWFQSHVIFAVLILFSPYITFEDIYRIFIFVSLFSILTVLAGAGAFSIDDRTGLFTQGRLRGVLGHPNITGMAGAVLILISVSSQKVRIFGAIIGSIVVLGSFSFTSIVALLIALVVSRTRYQKMFQWYLLAGLVVLLTPALLVERRSGFLNPDQFTGRTGIWEWAMAQLSVPLEQRGLGFFRLLQEQGAIPWSHAHNQVIMDLVSGGFLLAATGVLFITSMAFDLNRKHNKFGIMLWLVLVVQALTEIPLFLDYPSGRLLYLVLITALIVGNHNSSIKTSSTKPAARGTH